MEKIKAFITEKDQSTLAFKIKYGLFLAATGIFAVPTLYNMVEANIGYHVPQYVSESTVKLLDEDGEHHFVEFNRRLGKNNNYVSATISYQNDQSHMIANCKRSNVSWDGGKTFKSISPRQMEWEYKRAACRFKP